MTPVRPNPVAFAGVQIPDSRWAFFRGVARLPDAKPVRGLLNNFAVACSVGTRRKALGGSTEPIKGRPSGLGWLFRHAFLISDLLRRFVV